MAPIKPTEDTTNYFEWLDKLEQKPVSPRIKEIKKEEKQNKKEIDTDRLANDRMKKSNQH